MAEQPIPPDDYSPADRGLWRIKLELAKDQAAAFTARRMADLRQAGRSDQRS